MFSEIEDGCYMIMFFGVLWFWFGEEVDGFILYCCFNVDWNGFGCDLGKFEGDKGFDWFKFLGILCCYFEE